MATFADREILHDVRSGRLFVLNPSASSALKALRCGESEDEIVNHFADAASIEPKIAERDLRQFIDGLERANLLEADEQVEEQAGATPRLPPRPADGAASLDATYRLGDRLIRVVCHQGDVAAAFGQVAAPCLTTEEAPFQTRLTLFQHGNVFYVLENDRVVDQIADARSARWALVRELIGEGRGRQRLALLHASAVKTHAGCLLLCGESGAGKSTLLAGLVHAGFAYVADDIVMVEQGTGSIWPTPLSISIKEASWPLVETLFPQLATAPIVHFGGRTMRHIRVDPAQVAEDRGYPFTGVLFVRYQDGATTSLTSLDVAQSLVRLGEGGSILPDTDEGLQAFFALWRGTPAWELTYSRLDDAIDQLSALTGGPESPAISV